MKMVWILRSLVMAALFSLLYLYQTFYSLEGELTDRLVKEKRPVDERIVIVGIDEKTLSSISRNWLEWPRKTYVEVMQHLIDGRAKAVWLDILMTSKSEIAGDDQAMSAMVQKYPNIFLSTYYAFANGSGGGWQKPSFEVPASQLVHVNVFPDQDGVVREIPLAVETEERMVKAASVQLANRLLPSDQEIIYSEKGVWYRGTTPLVTNGRKEIPFIYAQPPLSKEGFRYYSLSDVLEQKVPVSAFRDAVVLIGAYAPSMNDAFATPISPTKMYGVEIHANMVQSLLDGKFYTYAPRSLGVALLFALSLFSGYLIDRYTMVKSILFLAGLFIAYTLIEILSIENGLLLPYVYPLALLASLFVWSMISHYRLERKERSYITQVFNRYVSPSIVKEILHHREDLQLGGTSKDVTVLFIDLRGFTSLSEQKPPGEIIAILNEYLQLCTEVIFNHQGTLDKFIGDGVMAFFGAPLDMGDHTEKAVMAALEMKQKAQNFPHPVSFGMGIHCGEVIVGNVGSKRRLDYTVIGDVVNLASRLESQAKPGQILVSEAVHEKMHNRCSTEFLGMREIKGKAQPIPIYEIR
ncbi:adenylate cyclase [Ammoniphilus resinae]|uniref:Adenylate cyclase n=1 Tax=Ammoniphilus resinae TaxID=861532 RepID=A0ABS4GPT3_9BACL|nr:adenylate cyclase [Ammoniphilus resinae]